MTSSSQDTNILVFFVHLEWDVNSGQTELRFLLDTENEVIVQVIHIGAWSLNEAVKQAVEEWSNEFGAGQSPFSSNESKSRLITGVAKDINPILSLILYTCSEKPEYTGGHPSRAQPKRTKKLLRFFPPDKPKLIHVGQATGDKLRGYESSLPSGDSEKQQGGNTGKILRPHIRSGHWHTFWVGSKKEGKQTFVYRWLSPIPVNTKV